MAVPSMRVFHKPLTESMVVLLEMNEHGYTLESMALDHGDEQTPEI